MRKNVLFSDRENVLKTFEITKTIYPNSKKSEQFLKQNAFLTSSWRFFRSNTLEKSVKMIGIYKHTGKVRKSLEMT